MEPIEKAEKLVFYSLGDWGTPGADILKVAAAMDKYAQTVAKPKFILALGDNFYPSGIAESHSILLFISKESTLFPAKDSKPNGETCF